MNQSIAMSSPDITVQEISAVVEVLQSSTLSLGPNLDRFESEFCRYAGTKYASAVSSGTAGLHLCMIASDVQEGDYVLTTPFSFIASANCILYQRALPVFVDIDPRTGNMNAEQAVEVIKMLALQKANGGALPAWTRHHLPERRSELKAVVLVHAFGQPCDAEPIIAAARHHGIAVIEDACEAVGAAYHGQPVGTLGDAAVFAFYPNKQMTTGEGGMIVYNRDDWHHLFRSLRNQGRDVFDAWLNHSRLGYNYRMDEMSAALGLVQLRRLEELLANRSRVAAWYNERLQNSPWLQPLTILPSTSRMSWFVYVVRLAPEINREQLMKRLEAQGIPSRPYFTPIHLQAFYREQFSYKPGDFPHAEAAGKTFMALPFHGKMSEDQVETVCAALKKELPRAAERKRHAVYVENVFSQAAAAVCPR